MMTKTKRTIYLVLGSLVFLSAITIINPFQTDDLFAGFKRYVKQVKVVNGSDMPIPVVVQGGNNNGQEKELVEIVELGVEDDDNTETVFDVYTVGTDKRLVITDVIVTNLGGNILRGLKILRDGVVVSTFSIGPPTGGVTYDHSYVSGIEFAEGEIVGISPGPSTAQVLTNWELRGYLTDLT